MQDVSEMQEDDFLDFLIQYSFIKELDIPISFVRLCFFAGYNSSLKRLETQIDEKVTKD